LEQVIALNSEATSMTNKSRFLAAMAEMELKQFPQALNLLETILANKSDESFRDEAEYYMALAYLGNHEGQKAAGIIAQIKANPNQTYYPLVAEISGISLKIIELKKN
jgi:thioredoxin-like negative regulator of GroEL